MYFLALSQAPPELDMKIAVRTPVTREPVRSPPSADGPKSRPTIRGAATAIRPGRNISRRAAVVEMDTQEA